MDAAVAERVLRERALALPEAYEEWQWGTPLFKVPGNRVFCFMSTGEEPVRATVKLERDEREVALLMPWCGVARYVGRYGWVTGAAVDDDALAAICDWLIESYWLRATPRLRKELESSPLWGGEEGE